MTWRRITDWTKHWHPLMRLAELLGRSRGRLRLLDGLHRPKPARRPDLRGWNRSELAAAWIGHSTILLRIGGRTVLTDPVLSSHIGLGLGLMTGGPRRLVAPALALADLPPLDLILVSHAHFDHLDRPTLCRLSKRVPVITAHDNADLIRDLGFRNVTEMRWGESLRVAGLTLNSQRVAHWGARTFLDQHRGFSAFVIQSGRHRVLFGGDTAYQEYFRDVGKVDLAILGIGSYNPHIRGHATPEQAWAMADHVRADHVLPMHHSTFRLSVEPTGEPIERLLSAAGAASDRIIIREVGGQWAI